MCDIEATKSTTIIKVVGKLYHSNGTLTKVTPDNDNVNNAIVAGMLHDVKSGTAHVINETEAGVTTEDGTSDVYSYDGASSTTVSDERIPIKTHRHKVEFKHKGSLTQCFTK